MTAPKQSPRTMKSVTDQYRDAHVTITSGHESDLSRVSVPHYSDEEHETWKIMYERQERALPNRATPEFLEALRQIQLPKDRIPTLKEVSKNLEKASGWRITRVDGLVPEKEFFECLSQKLFPCTDFIRPRNELEYTPSPDMFHDLYGHIPLIANPIFADFYEFYGKCALQASAEQLTKLQRIYWFSVEFGVIDRPEGRRIYGSGILSSPEEVLWALGDKVEVRPWSFKEVENQYFEIHHLQELIFSIGSFDEWLEGFHEYARKEQLIKV